MYFSRVRKFKGLMRNHVFPYFFDALIFAHLARCAAAILFLPAADILRRARVVFFAPPSSRCRTSVNFSISFRISCAMDSRPMAAPRFARCDRKA
jgi:hypothetical protein